MIIKSNNTPVESPRRLWSLVDQTYKLRVVDKLAPGVFQTGRLQS